MNISDIKNNLKSIVSVNENDLTTPPLVIAIDESLRKKIQETQRAYQALNRPLWVSVGYDHLLKADLVFQKALGKGNPTLELEPSRIVIFVIQGEKIDVDRTIVSAYSSVLKAMLDKKYKEAQDEEIVLEDVDPDVFRLFVDYCHGEPIPSRACLDLLVLSDRFDCLRLKEEVIKQVVRLIDTQDLITLQTYPEELFFAIVTSFDMFKIGNLVDFIRNSSQEGFVLLAKRAIIAAINKNRFAFFLINGHGSVLELINLLASEGQHLRYADLTNCRLGGGLLDVITKNFPNLTHLFLNSTQLVDEHVEKIVDSFPELITLDLANNQQLTDESLKSIALKLKKLTTLNLNNCTGFTNVGLDNILEGLNKLTGLSIRECRQITYLTKGSETLRVLDISWCPNFRDEQLENIIIKLPELTKLNIGYCTQITIRGFAAIVTKLKGLEILNLAKCNVDDRVLELISRGLKNLRSLDLSHCELIAATGFGHMAVELPNLQELHLSSCKITDEILIDITRHLRGLQKLNLSG